MKKIILSMKAEPFSQIYSKKKFFEYRKRFPKESVRAFIYVSAPFSEICGVIDFGARIKEGDIYAIPIKKFYETLYGVSLEKMRSFGLNPPQSYTYINDKIATFLENELKIIY